MANELNKTLSRHYRNPYERTFSNDTDYLEQAKRKCAPFVTAMVEAVRKVPDIPEKKGLMSAVIEFSRATEKHIANLELEMSALEYFISQLFERNVLLEQEVKRCHAKIDTADDISLSMVAILKRKLEAKQ